MKRHWLLLISALACQITWAQNNEPTDRPSRLKKDISYLASDELKGRQTGSPEEAMSANYIAQEFTKAKLTPQTQVFQIVQLRMATNNCVLGVSAPGMDTVVKKFTLFKDYYPLSQSSNSATVKADWYDCGYGLVSEKLQRDDYGNANIKGKIALIRLGYPGMEENPHAPIAEVADIPTKIAEALKRGAVGIIFIKPFEKFISPSGNLKRNEKTLDIPVFYCNQTGIFPQAPITMVSNIRVFTADAHNVYAFRNNHKKNTIVICAHHDHIGINEYENSRHTGPAEIHNGADDNASGVAAMLEMARSLKGKKYKKNNYLFIAFSGEELGLLGSKHFVQNPPTFVGQSNQKLGKINYVINIDMLGRIDTTKKVLTLNGVGTSPEFEKSISLITTDTNQLKITTTKSGLGPSDHASFYLENIPVIHFFSGQHEDYHKPSDDEALINYVGMANSLNVLEQLIVLNNKKGKLPFTKTQDAQMGRTKFKITLGVMPDYSFSGKGMRIDGVSEGKPAQKAGLQKGDIIQKLGDFDVNGVEDYMVGLGKLSAEKPTTVVVLRGSETLTFPIQFQ
ncbi:MAG: hypothetical protein RJA00_1564 [Bacteroidota bacterium]